MKIAVVTDDGKTISLHFGRAAHYLVFTVEQGETTGQELRDKMGHRQFAGEPHDHSDSHVHGMGQDAERKHARMIEAVADCEAVLVRGMGRGAYLALEQANIKPVVTDIADTQAAVQAYLDGTIVDHTEKLH